MFVLSETGERSTPEDGEYATEDKIYVIAGGKVTEIKDKPAESEQTPAEGSEEKNAEQFAEEQKEGEEEKKQSLEDRVTQIENILEQLCDYFGILRLRENEVAELRSQIEELKKDVEKHNQLVERTAVLERDLKTAFNRIDENRQDIKEVKK